MMLPYAVCNVSIDIDKQRIYVKAIALFQNKKHAESFCRTVPSLEDFKYGTCVVDVMTGEILNERSYSISEYVALGMTPQEGYNMCAIGAKLRYAVCNYFKGWRKRNGIESVKEKSV